jgi:hypothetical protein
MSLQGKITKWYEGEFIPHKNDPYDSVFVFGGTYKRHWTANVAQMAVKFWINHWQWTIGTVLAVCGLAIGLTRH